MHHLNLNSGRIQECSNDESSLCACVKFKNSGIYLQYKNEEEALKGLSKEFKNRFSWFGLRSPYSKARHLRAIEDFQGNFFNMPNSQLNKIANRNRSNFLMLHDVIELRVNAKIRKDRFRNDTATILEAYMNSRFYRNHALRVNPHTLGNATNFDESQLRKEILATTLSATDFGRIANYDFWTLNNKGAEIPGYLQEEMTDFVERRRVKADSVMNNTLRQERQYQKKIAKNSYDPSYGAMYWGTIWERKIRNGFAIDNPHLTVYEVDGKFRNNVSPWQLGIVDGAISDREDGVPNGILEIKTSKSGKGWKYGVPQNYRAQTLYYLRITGFEKAYVRVLINERETKEYILTRNSEIAEGSGRTVAEYIDNRIVPFLKSL